MKILYIFIDSPFFLISRGASCPYLPPLGDALGEGSLYILKQFRKLILPRWIKKVGNLFEKKKYRLNDLTLSIGKIYTKIFLCMVFALKTSGGKRCFCFVSQKQNQVIFELLYCKKVKYLYIFENGEKYTEI